MINVDGVVRKGNILALTFRRKQHGTNRMLDYLKEDCTYTIKVTVTSIRQTIKGEVYIGYLPIGISRGYCGGGTCTLHRNSKHYGCVDWKKLDEYTPTGSYGVHKIWQPQPGNPGYDLMC